MPIEIKELVIRATVDSNSQGATSSQRASGSSSTAKILRDSMDELVEMIKNNNER